MKYTLSVPCIAEWEQAVEFGTKTTKEVTGKEEAGYEYKGAFYYESFDIHLVYRRLD